MVTRRVKTGGAYVGAGGLGAPSPPQWQNTYEDQEFTGAYVADPGGGPDQWQYSGGGIDLGPYTPVHYNAPASGDVIVAGLHSSAATADGISFASLPAVSLTDFTAAGVNPITTSGGKAPRWNVGVNQPSATALLAAGGRYKIEVTTAGVASGYTVGSTKYFGSSGGGWIQKNTDGSITDRMPRDLTLLSGMKVTAESKEATMTLESLWGASGGTAWSFVDGLPVGRVGATWVAADFNNFYAGGLSSIADSWIGSTHRVQNLSLNSTPFTYEAHPVISSALFLGDSFTTYGSLLSSWWEGAGVICPWNPGYGYDSGDVKLTSNAVYAADPHDTSYIANFHRVMAKGGFLLENDLLSNQARSGAKFADMLVKVNALSSVPKLCIVGGGTNDIDGVGRTGYNIANTQAALAGLITALKAKGATRIIMWNPPSLRNSTSPYDYTLPQYDAAQTAVSDAIIAAAASDSAVTLVDMYTPFGGYTPTSDLFQSNNIHPSAKGSALLGKLMGEAAVAALTS